MNRTQRRALAHIESSTPESRHEKQSHRLTPQVCALWVPDYGGYLAGFSPKSFWVVEFAELAHLYVEDEATTAALAFREITGLRVAIRPYNCHH